jgi:hypothetical protein
MIEPEFYPLIYKSLLETKVPLNEIVMGELGNQCLSDGGIGKRYFLKAVRIKEHVSFDLNGLDGALPLDLGKKISGYDAYFDIVTDFGTSEHVYSQYWVFRNVYEFLKIGGIALHTLPLVGYWPKHGYYSYNEDFFINLSFHYGYELLCNDVVFIEYNGTKGMACAILRKKSFNNLISETTFYSMKGLIKEE